MFCYRPFLIMIIACLLSACASQLDKLSKLGDEPPLEEVVVPMNEPEYKPITWPEPSKAEIEEKKNERYYANSLWQPSSRDFLKGKKARRVGDILRVIVKIQDKAELDNETERSRQSNEAAGITGLYGIKDKLFNVLPGQENPASLLGTTGDSRYTGTGTVEREEKIETEVAAMVTQILPNGNLVIHGSQEIRVNFEVRRVTVDGIVQPQDLGADNSILSTQIAQARISYGGRGQLTEAQQPRVGTQIIDALSPF